MLIKLCGDKFIESTHIRAINRLRWQSAESDLEWIVTVGSNEYEKLTQAQFDELMDCLPSPAVSLKRQHSKGA